MRRASFSLPPPRADGVVGLDPGRDTRHGDCTPEIAADHRCRDGRRAPRLRPGGSDPHWRADRPFGPVFRYRRRHQRRLHPARRRRGDRRVARLGGRGAARRPPEQAGPGARDRPAMVRPRRGGRGDQLQQQRHCAGDQQSLPPAQQGAPQHRGGDGGADRAGLQRQPGAMDLRHLGDRSFHGGRHGEVGRRQMVLHRRRLRVRSCHGG